MFNRQTNRKKMCTELTDLFGNAVKATPNATAKKTTPTAPQPSETATQTAAISNEPVSVETLSISPNYIATYDTYLVRPNDNSVRTHEVNFSDNFHDCRMSASAQKSIKKCAMMVFNLSKKRAYAELKKKVRVGCTSFRSSQIGNDLYKDVMEKHHCIFVTLTLPAEQKHTDREICTYAINPFMSYAKKYWNVKHYLWKKELQSNGRLHFHFMFDHSIPWQSIRKEWNKLLNQGKVDGCDVPFDYVDRYHEQFAKMYANGFDREAVAQYVAGLPKTADKIKEAMEIDQEEFGRVFSDAAFNQLRKDTIEKIVAEYYDLYKKEISREITITYTDTETGKKRSYTRKLTFEERWRDPNSIDVKAVSKPRQVASYMSKYIAKDLEDNAALTDYQYAVDGLKREMNEWQKAVIDLKKNDQDYSEQMECWQRCKDALAEYRTEHCPIQGRMWFKSKSLTVFMKGAKEWIDDDYYKELTDLENYLHEEEKKIEERRERLKEKALERGDDKAAERYSKPVKLVLLRNDTNPDGTTNPDKVICKTLLINAFELENMRLANGRRRFPRLATAWKNYILKGIVENTKKGYYEKL